jgi:hypothetical protein
MLMTGAPQSQYGLNARALVHLPAVPECVDFDDCHVKGFAFYSKTAYLFA